MVTLMSAISTSNVVLLLIGYLLVFGEDTRRGNCMKSSYSDSSYSIAHGTNERTLPVTKNICIYILQIFKN